LILRQNTATLPDVVHVSIKHIEKIRQSVSLMFGIQISIITAVESSELEEEVWKRLRSERYREKNE
jgi:hypothetical protein